MLMVWSSEHHDMPRVSYWLIAYGTTFGISLLSSACLGSYRLLPCYSPLQPAEYSHLQSSCGLSNLPSGYIALCINAIQSKQTTHELTMHLDWSWVMCATASQFCRSYGMHLILYPAIEAAYLAPLACLYARADVSCQKRRQISVVLSLDGETKRHRAPSRLDSASFLSLERGDASI
jgi:hypothetical protein